MNTEAIRFHVKKHVVDGEGEGAPLSEVHITASEPGVEHEIGRMFLLTHVAEALVARLGAPDPEDAAEQRRLLLNIAYKAERLLGGDNDAAYPDPTILEARQELRSALAFAGEVIPELEVAELTREEVKTDLLLAQLRIKELEGEGARGLLAGAIEKLARSDERVLALERALAGACDLLEKIYTDDLDVGEEMDIAVKDGRALLAAGALPPEVAGQLSDPADLDKMDAHGRLFLRCMSLERALGESLTAIKPVAYFSGILAEAYDVILSGKARNYASVDFDTVAGARWTLVLQNQDPGAISPAKMAEARGKAAKLWHAATRVARSRAQRLRAAILEFTAKLLSPGPAHAIGPHLREDARALREMAEGVPNRQGIEDARLRSILLRAILVIEEASRRMHADTNLEYEGIAMRECAVRYRDEAGFQPPPEGAQGEADSEFSLQWLEIERLDRESDGAVAARFAADKKRRGW